MGRCEMQPHGAACKCNATGPARINRADFALNIESLYLPVARNFTLRDFYFKSGISNSLKLNLCIKFAKRHRYRVFQVLRKHLSGIKIIMIQSRWCARQLAGIRSATGAEPDFRTMCCFHVVPTDGVLSSLWQS